MKTPIDPVIIADSVAALRIQDVGTASIREIRRLIDRLETLQPVRFIRMEMGIPGLPASAHGVAAEKASLDRGVAALYPPVAGVPELKREMSAFIRNFVGISVPEEVCLPTVGSINGSFVTFMVAGRAVATRDTVLLLNPGFPLHAAQARMLGLKTAAFDVYEWRGDRLEAKMEEMVAQHNPAALLYSNPNNPAWICFTEDELAAIARVVDRHNMIAIEDLAYFAMDFRQPLGKPGVPPWQPTVARYTDRWIMMISSSKAFSYAGQRIGMLVVSPVVWDEEYPDLERYYSYRRFGDALLLGTLYPSTAGAAHSTQYGLAAVLAAVNRGEYDFVGEVSVYGARARRMKELFTSHGFTIVYDRDLDEPLADGFYFTVAYPGMDGEALIAALIPFGISAIALSTTGSTRTEGIRACVSLVSDEQIPELGRRLEQFNRTYGSTTP